MSNKLLLREFYELCEGGMCQDYLTEAEKIRVKNGVMILTGKMQEAGVKNGNGRVYNRNILEREVSNYMKVVRERRAMGELDHPDDSVVNLKNASHLVTDLWWEGNDLMGKVEILSTPSGQILRSLINDGIKLGISSRGLGSVEETHEGTIVQEDFQLICWDFVSEPSTPDAYMIAEGKQKALLSRFTKGDRINRALNDVLLGAKV